MQLRSIPRPPRPLRALAALGAGIAGASATPAAAEGRRYDAFATVSPQASFKYVSESGGPSTEGWIVELGIGGSASRRFRTRFDLGLGLRYDYGRDSEYPDDAVHHVAVPALAALVIPIGDGRELRAGIGLGPGFAFSLQYGGSDGRLSMLGGNAELALDFAQRLRSNGLGLRLQVGVRFDLLHEISVSSGYLDGGIYFHMQAPFVRAGATWR